MGRIADFLNLYGKKNTKIAYRSAISLYFDIIFNNKRTRVRSNEAANEVLYETQADRYFAEVENGDRNVSNDLLVFVDFLQDKPPLAILQQ